jgi:hypothetical protein
MALPASVYDAMRGRSMLECLVLLPEGLEAVPVEPAAYAEALEMMPPTVHLSSGFLLGEVYTHRPCRVLGGIAPAYTAYTNRAFVGQDRQERRRHHRLSLPVTKAEFLLLLHFGGAMVGELAERWYQRSRTVAWMAYMDNPHAGRLPYGWGLSIAEAIAAARHQWAGASAALQRHFEERLQLRGMDEDEASEMAEWFAAPWGATA